MAIIGVVQGLNGRAGPPVQVVAGEQFPDKFPPQLGGMVQSASRMVPWGSSTVATNTRWV